MTAAAAAEDSDAALTPTGGEMLFSCCEEMFKVPIKIVRRSLDNNGREIFVLKEKEEEWAGQRVC